HQCPVRFLVALPPVSDLLLCAKHLLFVAIVAIDAASSAPPATSLKGIRVCGTITAATTWLPERSPTQRRRRSRQSAQRPPKPLDDLQRDSFPWCEARRHRIFSSG